ncbi:MAG: hypothetical protein EOO14_23610, partial [Chitinophagaceae bacterium]
MKRTILLCYLIIVTITGAGQAAKHVPTLEDVSGIWIHADTISMTPSVRNFRAQASVNRDMASLSWFASAPYSGGYHTGVLRVNGEAPRAQLFRWFPWQALRKMKASTYSLASTVKMVPEADAVLWEITLTNTTAKTQRYAVEQDLIGFISRYEKKDWPWGYPYPTLQGATNARTDEIVNVVANVGLRPAQAKVITADVSVPNQDTSNVAAITWPSDKAIMASLKYSTRKQGNNRLLVRDTETDALTGFSLIDVPEKLVTQKSGGTAYWNFSLQKGESKKIRFLMTYAKSE